MESYVGWDTMRPLGGVEGFEDEEEFHAKSGFVQTKSGIIISRSTLLCGPQNIKVEGKSILKGEAIIRADLAPVKIGTYCLVNERAVIRPPFKRFRDGIVIPKIQIGNHVVIEEDCIISALSIGSFVHIGAGSIVSPRCILKDCCRILPGSVLPPDTVVPPFACFGGVPARLIEELPDSFERRMKDLTETKYKKFRLSDQ
eukprot:TRINITY_DN21895_c0_g1_i5.p1 TRINITY_DN21895_c0_g1~~TRINITY_DN21895_c0_g1_i5.p1  ORF type:complete len:200 (+),score=42.21 TRINITY_DN21895_c0_g1_i5:244-843(+)